jgi:tetratricopeptide (TPR) repeat protein
VPNSLALGKTQRLAKEEIEAGHTLANHTFTHAFLPKLSDAKLEEQLTDTTQALLPTTKTAPALFRPPYGARNEEVLKIAAKLAMKTVLWNVDSMDWADPVPASIAKRVLSQIEKEKRGIVLFHDIQARCPGYRAQCNPGEDPQAGGGEAGEGGRTEGELAAATASLENPGGAKKDPVVRAIPDGGGTSPASPPVLLPSTASAMSAVESRREVDRGMGPFREKRYPEAAQAFATALKYKPDNVLAAKNLGFTYVKMDQLPEAITWYEKTLVLDPMRALAYAYANLGDAYAKLGRIDDAKRAYKRFLELRPDHKLAPAVRERLAKLSSQHP